MQTQTPIQNRKTIVKMPNNRFERDAPPASFACCLRAPQAKRSTACNACAWRFAHALSQAVARPTLPLQPVPHPGRRIRSRCPRHYLCGARHRIGAARIPAHAYPRSASSRRSAAKIGVRLQFSGAGDRTEGVLRPTTPLLKKPLPRRTNARKQLLLPEHHPRKRRRVSASASQKAPRVVSASTSAGRRGWAGHWSMNRGRTSSTAFVSGSAAERVRTRGGSCSRGKNTPERNIMGVSISVKHWNWGQSPIIAAQLGLWRGVCWHILAAEVCYKWASLWKNCVIRRIFE